MLATARYRRHHVELLTLFHEVLDVSVGDVEQSATKLSRSLSRMYGLLVVHLALEDRSLYPRMRSCGDKALEVMASKYESEMGHLKEQFEAFYQEWSTENRIRQDSKRFKWETDAVIGKLLARLERENRDFYPRIDALGEKDEASDRKFG